ncbi:MAG: hypothetical protein P8Y97_22600 [Candidatus Lokiarchaeota archaeon]
MNEEKLLRLEKLINSDIKTLGANIEQYYNKLLYYLKNENLSKSSVKLDMTLFKELMNNYYDKTLSKEFKIKEKNKYNKFFLRIPKNRLQLFKEIFIKDIVSILYSPNENIITQSPIIPSELYARLFYTLFHKNFFEKVNLKELLENFYDDWRKILKENQIKTQISLDFLNLNISENFTDNSIYKIIRKDLFEIMTLEPFIYTSKSNSYLLFEEYIPIRLIKKESKRFNEQRSLQNLSNSIFKRIYEKFERILLSLYLEGVKIPMTKPKMKKRSLKEITLNLEKIID